MAARRVNPCADGMPGCRFSPGSRAGCLAGAGTRGRAVVVCLVGGEAVGLPAWPAQPHPRDADLLQDQLELGAVRTLTWGDDQGQRAAEPVRAQVELAGEPAARAAQALTSSTTSTRRATMLCHGGSSWCSTSSAPFEAGAGGGSVRAPAAC